MDELMDLLRLLDQTPGRSALELAQALCELDALAKNVRQLYDRLAGLEDLLPRPPHDPLKPWVPRW
jgi:hypothetical protein